jgi:hypothetical protein
MRHILGVAMLGAVLLAFVVPAAVGAAGSTFTIDCGGGAVTVTKPNDSASIYRSGTTSYITAIGSLKTDGTAQRNAVVCDFSGDDFGPIALPFLIIHG